MEMNEIPDHIKGSLAVNIILAVKCPPEKKGEYLGRIHETEGKAMLLGYNLNEVKDFEKKFFRKIMN